jgi:hypothetical protein
MIYRCRSRLRHDGNPPLHFTQMLATPAPRRGDVVIGDMVRGRANISGLRPPIGRDDGPPSGGHMIGLGPATRASSDVFSIFVRSSRADGF